MIIVKDRSMFDFNGNDGTYLETLRLCLLTHSLE